MEDREDSGITINGDLRSINFPHSLKEIACKGHPLYDDCLNETTEFLWKALITNEEKLKAEFYSGPLYRLDKQTPVQALQTHFQDGHPFMRKQLHPSVNEKWEDQYHPISEHLNYPKNFFTSASYESKGTINYLCPSLPEKLGRCDSTYWFNSESAEMVQCEDMPDLMTDPTDHPNHFRVFIRPQYFGSGAGAKFKGDAVMIMEREVTTIGFQPTHVRYVIVVIPPTSDDFCEGMIEDPSVFNALASATPWRQLSSKNLPFPSEDPIRYTMFS